jgi:HD-GYP domain-containing protein (c-di-GMP phosphodiesterase class II)
VVHRGGDGDFGVPQLALLGELGQLVGLALGHQARRDLYASDPEAEVEGLLRTLAPIELAGGEHGVDVTDLSRLMADELALSACERLELELGAHLHDVGKLRVPRQILCKSGPLTNAEWQVMRRHPLWGAEMVASIPGLEAVALVVRAHHERWDGCGYPDRLAGDEIPLASRIIALCDAFSAMTSNRPYRPALEPAAALLELDAAAGSQFDPGLTRLFARALGGAVRKETDSEGKEAESHRVDGDARVGPGVPRGGLRVGQGPEGDR